MDDVLKPGALPVDTPVEKTAAPPKRTWALMGDVATFRGGVPEHLIQWNRAKGEADPDPQL